MANPRPPTPPPGPGPTEHQPARPPETEGVHRLRVRYCECDPMRVAHHASYVPWLEEARTELLRTSGIAYSQLEAAGVYLAVIGLQIAYKRPALYDDLLDIHVRVASVTRVKIRHEYEVRLAERPGLSPEETETFRQAGHDLLITAETTLACLDAQGRPRVLPAWLAETPPAT
ncbi:MAG: acyl-CoA thioesterase [Planctomycetota bacterium]|nr:MAG: acyl-CoA thioesterase [Planctomycetota bacterium]